MTHSNGNDMATADKPRYATPTFNPRSAFARTLRSGEIARLKRRQPQVPDPSEFASGEPDREQRVNGNERSTARARIYETPTFAPRSAFARTLRSGEIGRLQRQPRLADPRRFDLLALAS